MRYIRCVEVVLLNNIMFFINDKKIYFMLPHKSKYFFNNNYSKWKESTASYITLYYTRYDFKSVLPKTFCEKRKTLYKSVPSKYHSMEKGK